MGKICQRKIRGKGDLLEGTVTAYSIFDVENAITLNEKYADYDIKGLLDNFVIRKFIIGRLMNTFLDNAKKLYQMSNKDEYIAYLNSCIKCANSKHDYLIFLDKLIDIYLDLDKIEELKKLLDEINSTCVEYKMRRCRIIAKIENYEGNYSKSFDELSKILSMTYNIAEYHNSLFIIYVRMSLVAILRKTKKKDWIENANENLKMALDLVENDSLQKNIFGFETVEARALIYYEYSLYYEEMGNLSEAYKYMRLADELKDELSFSPIYINILDLKITILVSKGEFNNLKDFAVEVFELNKKAIICDIDLLDIINNIVRGLFKNEEYDYGITILDRAVDIIDKSICLKKCRVSFIYNTLGLCYLYLGNYEQALRYFNLDLSLQYAIEDSYNSACSSIMNNIGKTYFKMGEYQKAESSYQISHEIKKKFDDAPSNFSTLYNNLAEVYLKLAEINLNDETYLNKAQEYVLMDSRVRNSEFIKYDLLSILTAIRVYIYAKNYTLAFEIINKFIRNSNLCKSNDSVTVFNDLLDLVEKICHETMEDQYKELHNKFEKLYIRTIKNLENADRYPLYKRFYYEIITDMNICETKVEDNIVVFKMEDRIILLVLSNQKNIINNCISICNTYKTDKKVTILTNRLFRYLSYNRLEIDADFVLYHDYKKISPKQNSIYESITYGIFKNQSLPKDYQWSLKNNKIVEHLRHCVLHEKINLFLGAGVSIEDGGKTWEELIEKLFSENLNLASRLDMTNGSNLKQYIKSLNLSPLALGRFLENNNEFFISNLQNILYDKKLQFNKYSILNIIANSVSCLKNVVTYNYDDFLEQYLKHNNVPHKVISHKNVRTNSDVLAIYQVHGYLPHQAKKKVSIVWKEEDYHALYENFFSWNNKVQLEFLIHDNNLFIGHSLTDPNLRRLLDVANRGKIDFNNYTFMYDKNIDSTYRLIQENIAFQLGIKIIWIQDYSEIKSILKYVFFGIR